MFPKIPEKLKNFIIESKVFIYSHLLPKVGFRDTPIFTKHTSLFIPSED